MSRLRATSGNVLLRRPLTSSLGGSDCGAERGYTSKTAVAPLGLRRAGETEATSATARSEAPIVAVAVVSPARGNVTTTWSGPLTPAPKPFASRSYAWRVVELQGLLPASLFPRRSARAGAASEIGRASCRERV